jgi:hypothetical protein
MIKTTAWFDFRQPVAYDPERKLVFHGQARSRLRRLAAALGLRDSDYEGSPFPARRSFMPSGFTFR